MHAGRSNWPKNRGLSSAYMAWLPPSVSWNYTYFEPALLYKEKSLFFISPYILLLVLRILCPRNKTWTRPDALNWLQEEGHISRDCPTKRKMTCFKCNEEGHMSRECPTGGSGGGRGGGRGKPLVRKPVLPDGLFSYQKYKFGLFFRGPWNIRCW
jgi:hypothetical protein